VVLGGTAAWAYVSRRARARHLRWVGCGARAICLRHQNTRASNARLKVELEKERAAAQGKIAAGTADLRKAASRLESELRIARAEIDRLVREVAEYRGESSPASLLDALISP